MKKCFLIDDDKIFNLISAKMISRSGWDVDVKTYLSAELALNDIKCLIETPELLPNIILLDVRMPDLDGMGFLEKLALLPQDFLSNLSIFMLSSSLDERDMNGALKFPNVKGFLNKPLSIDDLKGIIHQS
jgi:CheY-like chemotaxis protein